MFFKMHYKRTQRQCVLLQIEMWWMFYIQFTFKRKMINYSKTTSQQ